MTEHCRDCCCARSWKALGITGYTGKSIPEHISELQAENDKLKEENEALGWFVSTLADVFNYNENSSISPVDVSIWLNTVNQADNFTRDDYKKIHALIIKNGLVTLPTSNKAIKALKGNPNDD